MPRPSKRPDTHGPRIELLPDRELFTQIISQQSLQTAWGRVWSNAGASGGDNVTVQRYAVDVLSRLSRLRQIVRAGEYRPGPLRTVHIPKRSGKGLRKLCIPCVADRVLQTSTAMVLTPLLDAEFEPASFGYRRGRSVAQAVRQVSLAGRDGFDWVVDADIEDYFGSIVHEHLMDRWHQSIDEGPLGELIWSWLTHAAPSGRGVAQGSPLSPLLANLYLDRLDEALYGHGLRLVRFADDFVILCRSKSGAQGALDKCADLLGKYDLRLNRDKTRIVDFERGFDFLGHLFVRSMVMKSAPEQVDEQEVEKFLRRIAKEDTRAKMDALTVQAEGERKQRHGYSPGFRVLHIRSRDRRLSVRNQAFAVEEGSGRKDEQTKWRELIAIPHQQVDRIDLGPNVVATDEALRHALASDTPIAWVNGHGQTLGWLNETLAPRAARHLDQARLSLDGTARLELARIFVEARLRNQRAVLRRLLANRDDKPQVVLDALVTLNKLIGRGDTSYIRHAPDINHVMGFEGQATAVWWRAVSALARPEFAFAKRDRDRGANPANICLNFLAWLLHRDVSVAVMRAGLHPGFGALHAVSDRRDACVYDLMEEFRAHLIGGLFVYITNRRLIRPEMFDVKNTKTRMKSTGGDALIRAYETRVGGKVKSPRSGKRVSWRRLMVEQALALAAHVEGGETYRPVNMDY